MVRKFQGETIMATYTVTETNNYDIFVEHENNRPVNVNSKKYKKLLQSMKQHGFLPFYPIWCKLLPDGRLSVQVGHHRLAVAKQLKIRLCYMIYNSDFKIWEEGFSTNAWTMTDHLVNQVSNGDSTALVIKNYHEATGISLAQCIGIFADRTTTGYGGNGDAFKKGTFKIMPSALLRSELIKSIVHETSKINKEIATQSNYVSALLKISTVDRFCVDRYITKLKAHSPLLVKCMTVDGYVEMIEGIYNRKVSIDQRVPVAFLTRREMQKRNPNVVK